MTNKSKDPSVYLIAGKDAYLVTNQAQKVVDSLLSPDEKTLSLLSLDSNDAQPTNVLDELRTLPFLAKKRVVHIKDADKFISANRDLLERYFENPASSGILVMSVSSWAKNTRLAKKLPPIGQLIEVGEIKNYKLADFVINYARSEHNKKIDRQAAQLLVELTGTEPGRLTGEIDKLAVYNDKTDIITTQDIAKLTGNNRIFDAFNVINEMSSGNTKKAVVRLRKMFAADRSSQYTIIGAFSYHFRQMFTAKAMLEKRQSKKEVISKCRIWGDIEGFFRRLSKLTLSQLANILTELAKIDHGSKTGRTTIPTAIENLVIKTSLRK